MNKSTESLPADFNPETAFALALQNAADKSNRPDEIFTPRRSAQPTEDGIAERGIPQSALHD